MSESSDTRIVLSNIQTDGGDVAAGNIDKRVTNNYTLPDSQLKVLYEKLAIERKSDEHFVGWTEAIGDYVATDADEVIGLERKLTEGGMECQFGYASDAKEKYVKNLAKHQMFESAQLIHCALLNKVESGFHTSVKPRLSSITPPEKMELMQQKVLVPIEQALGENPLLLYSKELDGMAYFLTGKCKIAWSA
jgi:hypothetical protein